MIAKAVNKFRSIAKKLGQESIEERFPDFGKDVLEIIQQCKPYTMTTEERLFGLYNAVEYIAKNKIEGDFVECGVWKGGSSMCAMLSLKKQNDTSRQFYLYDTYEGMSAPSENDKDVFGVLAQTQLEHSRKENQESVWCYSPLEDVKSNIGKTNYPTEKMHFVKGMVEQTIPATIPDKIALLRLDTDWFDSTYHELVHLFPKLVNGGIIIIDDYGHWQGARGAVDKYFQENKVKILLNRLDYTGRIGVKL